ncbi:MAG: hypothetical protein Q9168_007772 [Polycauliona sp. 1 TL-2023]
MEAVRTPGGQRDMGDDAYGDSIIEAASYVLDDCVRRTARGGWAKGFSELPTIPSIDHMKRTNSRLEITFSSYASRMPNIRCETTVPSPPLDQAFQDKVSRALLALPTNEKVTTFNHTRLPGPAGSSVVTYLLPRREPVGE